MISGVGGLAGFAVVWGHLSERRRRVLSCVAWSVLKVPGCNVHAADGEGNTVSRKRLRRRPLCDLVRSAFIK